MFGGSNNSEQSSECNHPNIGEGRGSAGFGIARGGFGTWVDMVGSEVLDSENNSEIEMMWGVEGVHILCSNTDAGSGL